MPPRMPVALGWILSSAMLVPTGTGADPQESGAPTAEAYLAHVEDYASGDRQRAIDAVLGLSASSLDRAQDEAFGRLHSLVASAFRAVKEGTGPRSSFHSARRSNVRTSKLSVALHVEALALSTTNSQLDAQFQAATRAIAQLLSLERDVIANGPVFDLEWQRLEEAGTIVNREEQARRGRQEWLVIREVGRQAYLTLVSYFGHQGSGEPLGKLLEQALAAFRDDPCLLLARGSYREALASALAVDTSLLSDIYSAPDQQLWRIQLRRAEEDLLKAWTLAAPDLPEAALRLARVRQLQGKPDAAGPLLAIVRQQGHPPFLRYLAFLFLAQQAEEDGDVKAAHQMYRESLALMPLAQAPALALSRLADAKSDQAEARRWLARSFAAVGAEREDPWWRYMHGQGWQLRERVDRLREMALP